ncbi:hypothetical protein [Mucilaginibacter arboris]|uniref:Uncharacterized protein n=1 Tax=Mucilaginibacter arboris TaxID=2682090 RepID=A0A7K1STL9_9SPHI|nr:hypothetical protein [Mucilaginibacter arboris]MVN20641.1 hypothetical protein [Mucilaginibacter arboris]
MTKIIIQPGKYRGLYQIILLQCRRFLIVKWWKAISITEHFEEEAVLKLCELIKKYNIKPCSIYDWSEDGSYEPVIKKQFERRSDLDAVDVHSSSLNSGMLIQ